MDARISIIIIKNNLFDKMLASALELLHLAVYIPGFKILCDPLYKLASQGSVNNPMVIRM